MNEIKNTGINLCRNKGHIIRRKIRSSADTDAALESGRLRNRDYIEIPLNFKYKLGLPVVGKIITPYVFTGPSVAFLTSKKAITEAYKNKSVDVAWNFGLGGYTSKPTHFIGNCGISHINGRNHVIGRFNELI